MSCESLGFLMGKVRHRGVKYIVQGDTDQKGQSQDSNHINVLSKEEHLEQFSQFRGSSLTNIKQDYKAELRRNPTSCSALATSLLLGCEVRSFQN